MNPTLVLAPCRHCGCPKVAVLTWDGGRFLTIICSACGARGPVHALATLGMDPDAVGALCADEWNAVHGTEEWHAENGVKEQGAKSPADGPDIAHSSGIEEQAEPPGGGGGSGTEWVDALFNSFESVFEGIAPRDPAPELTPEEAPTATAASPQRKVPRAAKNGSKPAPKSIDAGTEQAPKAPDGGGAAGADLKDGRHARVRDRLRAYLQILGCSVETAVKSRGLNFGASVPTLYNFLKGIAVKQETLAGIDAALSALEKLADHDRIQAAVEVLPTTLPEITGLNPIPKLKAPPRCGSTA